MSLIHKTKKIAAVLAHEKLVVSGVKCELCPRVGCGEDSDGGGDYSETDEPDIFVTRVSIEDGQCDYDGGGRSEKLVLDICPDCFKRKLVPWFEAQGGQTRKTEVDW